MGPRYTKKITPRKYDGEPNFLHPHFNHRYYVGDFFCISWTHQLPNSIKTNLKRKLDHTMLQKFQIRG